MPFVSGIGPLELIIILVIALIVVGPGRLPDVGAALGKSIREFRKAATDVKDATSIDPAAPAVPGTPAAVASAVPAVSTAALPPAPPVAAEPPAVASDASAPVETAPPDVSELPEPVPVADEQAPRTA